MSHPCGCPVCSATPTCRCLTSSSTTSTSGCPESPCSPRAASTPARSSPLTTRCRVSVAASSGCLLVLSGPLRLTPVRVESETRRTGLDPDWLSRRDAGCCRLWLDEGMFEAWFMSDFNLPVLDLPQLSMCLQLTPWTPRAPKWTPASAWRGSLALQRRGFGWNVGVDRTPAGNTCSEGTPGLQPWTRGVHSVSAVLFTGCLLD